MSYSTCESSVNGDADDENNNDSHLSNYNKSGANLPKPGVIATRKQTPWKRGSIGTERSSSGSKVLTISVILKWFVMKSGTISLTIPKLKLMEEGLVNPH